MTIHQIAQQLFDSSVAGYFNGEKFTRRELELYIASMFREGTSLKAGNRLVMEIALPDGRWYFFITHYGAGADEFDYTIPDDRDQEAQIKGLLA